MWLTKGPAGLIVSPNRQVFLAFPVKRILASFKKQIVMHTRIPTLTLDKDVSWFNKVKRKPTSDPTFSHDKDVSWFQVPVQNPVAMQVVDTAQNLVEEALNGPYRNSIVLLLGLALPDSYNLNRKHYQISSQNVSLSFGIWVTVFTSCERGFILYC